MMDEKKNEIRYSIIVPVYNGETYIEKCIKSLLNQNTKSNYEIILINDGSTDLTEKKCKEFEKDNQKIKYFFKENSGVSETRNFALTKAKGKYILFCDSDDYVDNGFLKKIDELYKKNYDLINFGLSFDVVKKDGTLVSNVLNYEEKEYLTREEIKADFINLWDASMMYNVVNKAFKLDLIRKHNLKFPSYTFGEDMDFCINYVRYINNFYNSSACFYHYIRGIEGAATEIYRDDFFELRKKEFIKMNKYFEEWGVKKEDYYEFSCRRLSDRLLGCIENVFCSKKGFSFKYKKIKKILNDKLAIESLKNTKKISFKNKVIRIPIKLRLTFLTYLEMSFIHFVKTKFLGFFNKLKYSR